MKNSRSSASAMDAAMACMCGSVMVRTFGVIRRNLLRASSAASRLSPIPKNWTLRDRIIRSTAALTVSGRSSAFVSRMALI